MFPFKELLNVFVDWADETATYDDDALYTTARETEAEAPVARPTLAGLVRPAVKKRSDSDSSIMRAMAMIWGPSDGGESDVAYTVR